MHIRQLGNIPLCVCVCVFLVEAKEFAVFSIVKMYVAYIN